MVQRKLESCCSKQQRPSIEQIVRNMEYNRLRLLIPALATRQGVPKVICLFIPFCYFVISKTLSHLTSSAYSQFDYSHCIQSLCGDHNCLSLFSHSSQRLKRACRRHSCVKVSAQENQCEFYFSLYP